MMIPSPVRYPCPDATLADRALKAVSEQVTVRQQSDPPRSTRYFDTFDWRLFADGRTLAEERRGEVSDLLLQKLDGTPEYRASSATEPGFAADLPPGPLADAITPTLEMRRLLPRMIVEAESTTLSVLDERQKTVARLRLERSSVRAAADTSDSVGLPTALTALPVKGYDKHFRALRQLLEQSLGLEADPESAWTLAAAAAGLEPGGYSSKLNLHLDPRMPAADALISIYQRLVEVIEANVEGVLRDLDSEFLHDFRVAVRRTRSAMTQVKGVLPQESIDRFKRDFAWLGQITGPSRDLHVYQLKMPDYQASLPEATRPDLEPLRTYLDRHQQIEHRDMVHLLESDRYTQLLASWKEFLDDPSRFGDFGPKAILPALELASARIWRAFRKVVKRGSAIGKDSPPEPLHRLRIDCKKLRYLLEFFRSLYDEDEIAALIKALKQLQDNLGDFNDLVVQRAKLREFGSSMQAEQIGSAATLMAMGRLIADLERRQEEERRAFHERFREFSRPRNRRRFKRLFKKVESTWT